ncbi:DinB family protein [Chitinophaga lutea]
MPRIPFSTDTRLRTQHFTLSEIAAAAPAGNWHKDLRPGKWTAFEQLAHLAVFQPLFLHRFERILQEDEPLFDRYVWQEDMLFARYKTISLNALLDVYRHDRETVIATIEGWDEAALRRKGIHPVYGRFSLAQWVDMFLLHEAHHIFSLYPMAFAEES